MGLMMTQQTLAQWQVYPALSNVERISTMHDKAYILFGNTLCSAPTSNIGNYSPFTRNEGLSEVSVFDIRYSETADRLAVVYVNGFIDLILPDGTIKPIPDYANTSIQGDRSIQSIAMTGDSLLIETGIGTLLVDVSEALVRKTITDVKAACGADMKQLTNNGIGYDDNAKQTLIESLDDNRNMVKNAAQMRYHNGRLILAQSSYLYFGVYGGAGHVSILDTESGDWSQVYRNDVMEAAKRLTPTPANRNSMDNILAVGIDEADAEKFYVANDGNGIFCFDHDTLYQHITSVSFPGSITDILPDKYYCRVTALHGDEKGNLWYVCAAVDENQLHCRTADGNFITFPIKGFTNASGGEMSMTISKHSGYPFIWLNRSYTWDEFGGAVYYLNATDTIVSDDMSTHFSSLHDQDGNQLHPQYLYKTFEDNDGVMWILTSDGPFTVPDQVAFFNHAEKTNVGNVTRIKIPRNDGTNLADYLLPNVPTNCGLVDAANRKWIGTIDNGVYLLSADGLEQLEHFTTDNSPLFSNAIQSMEYDAESGQLFISCEGGICVYKSDAVSGASDNNSIYCYPNPVRSNFTGQLKICGLMDNTEVRITDSSARVVYRALSAGGIATWDLNDGNGNRVKPGVYMIFGIDEDGKDGGSCKFLVQ